MLNVIILIILYKITSFISENSKTSKIPLVMILFVIRYSIPSINYVSERKILIEFKTTLNHIS